MTEQHRQHNGIAPLRNVAALLEQCLLSRMFERNSAVSDAARRRRWLRRRAASSGVLLARHSGPKIPVKPN